MTERPSSTRIEGCRVCGGSRLRSFLNLGSLPLSDGFLSEEQLAVPEPLFPLEIALCLDCALVQTLDTVDSRLRFGADYRYLSSVTASLVSLAEQNVAQRIRERNLGPGSLVVEVASNDGYLLRHYADRAIPVLGIDPAPRPVAAAIANGIPTRRAFFGRDVADGLAAEGIQAAVIHANNVLAHVEDTVGFVAGIKTLLAPDG
ncbi:MAG: methyltransferase, partial [Gemmatimonadota bacterium]